MSKGYEVTTNSLVITGSGALSSVVLSASSTNSSVIVYDNTEGSGTILLTVRAVANTTSPCYVGSKTFVNGVYVAVTGDGGRAYIDIR